MIPDSVDGGLIHESSSTDSESYCDIDDDLSDVSYTAPTYSPISSSDDDNDEEIETTIEMLHSINEGIHNSTIVLTTVIL